MMRSGAMMVLAVFSPAAQMKFNHRAVLISCVLVACVGCDQATKHVATSVLANSPKTFLSDIVRLQLRHNSGGFLSLGDTLPAVWKSALFCFGVSGWLLSMLVYAVGSKRIPARVSFALALCVAGGIGNLLDRLRSGGYVVDFLDVGIGPIRTGVFNMADMAIMAGALLLLVAHFRSTSTP
jgi:signal peptidase II